MPLSDENEGAPRRPCRQIFVGDVPVGGHAPVSVQSMTNTDTRDITATVAQISTLAQAGCDIVRCAVPDKKASECLPEIITQSPMPVVADIHYDYNLALAALDTGAHCIRVNPGTMEKEAHQKAVAERAGDYGVPVRIGVNSGSVESDIREKYGGSCPAALVESARRHCANFEQWGCTQLKVSLKSSSVRACIEAYRLFAAKTPYPLHIGVTEAGTYEAGTVKSAIGIGALLLEGIGDTLRVSLTAPPVKEVEVGNKILGTLGLKDTGPEIVTCPTCGRTEIELFPIVEQVENEIMRLRSQGYRIPFRKIAIMGCSVNGPGEAREADIGIAGGRGNGVLFQRGEVVRKLEEDRLAEALIQEIHKVLEY